MLKSYPLCLTKITFDDATVKIYRKTETAQDITSKRLEDILGLL